MKNIKREKIKFDVIIIGGGVAGLSAAIHIKQLANISRQKITVCILEKGNYIGSHIISGAIMNPISISELFPNWLKLQFPIEKKVINEKFFFLSKTKSYKLPIWFLPKSFKNKNNYIVSLTKVTQWLGKKAENLGIEIFPGFSVTKILFNKNQIVKGVITKDLGIDKNNIKTKKFQLGIELHAKYTFFAEGARGNLAKQLIKKYNLNKNKDPQKYSLGIKEIWEINKNFYKPGTIIHTFGWPFNKNLNGGSFLYHIKNQQISIGCIISLSYNNPYISPHEEFQKYKTHPKIKKILINAKRIAYGARSINIGGINSIPNLIFPGGIIIGCNAGFLNASSAKGIHTSIKSGMLAAKSVNDAIKNFRKHDKLKSFNNIFKNSWLYEELYKVRNFNSLINKGFIGKILIGIEQKIFQGKIPYTLHIKKEDYKYLKPISNFKKIKYLKHDEKLTFSKLSSIFYSNVNHTENQPSHLIIKNYKLQEKISFKVYGGPEEKYCPANVYEYTIKNNINKLKINFQNCIHCKTCDIKDPFQNITWIPPEGGGGPNYINM
ncbi:electron transfer flavoprotein-ubiquinone oxidoreductase [Candidatus Zinderia endosymbiont of Aphrophora alni]|uniref:electron transfer flavoprotein-ubiquinone oxidoreductase n=1 Tax=Candidatus Zinderia endosymbiont of Aphrophora alni TaxID=3077951 RepID=UPI0030D4E9BB